ncbi:hypothetical protein B0O80DRAFT_432913 [Mortierella sp. GBAus27b]|nr:hypothetical protein B0O80DRAFT_432913 [Mortierella sp. GBAus27b]
MTFRGASFLLFVNWLCIVIWLTTSFESTDATIVVLATNDTYVDRTAAFGPRIPEEGLVLNLIAIEILDKDGETAACKPVTGAPANVAWVALVERGGRCSFVDKVRNMQASGASAVIVGDNQKGNLITMYARDTSDVLIPSVFITQNHYRELRYFGMELGKGFLVKILPDDIDWPVLDVIIFIILSPAFVVLFMFFLWKMRMRRQRLADLAPPEVVSNLPVKVYFKSKAQPDDSTECVICLEEYKDEDELRVLPCKHEYHVACIDNWLTNRKKFCPICKRDICVPTERTPLLGGASSREENTTATPSTSTAAPSTSTPVPGPGPSTSQPLAASSRSGTADAGSGQGSRASSSAPVVSTAYSAEDEVLRRV